MLFPGTDNNPILRHLSGEFLDIWKSREASMQKERSENVSCGHCIVSSTISCVVKDLPSVSSYSQTTLESLGWYRCLPTYIDMRRVPKMGYR